MSGHQFSLSWPAYKLLPYEREIAIREAKALLCPSALTFVDKSVQIRTNSASEVAEKLTYFSAVSNVPTTQALLESSGANGNGSCKQSTRYSVHGLHEYKGKFNPQIARSILNCFGLSRSERVWDPFCGSGTTLVESSQMGLRAVGTDVNPLAAHIASAKLTALRTPADEIEAGLDNILLAVRKARRNKYLTTPRNEYLRAWFEPDILREIEALWDATDQVNSNVKQVLKIAASDLLRTFSLQEPMDLRIRRRKTPLPLISFAEAFSQKAHQFLTKLRGAQSVLKRFAPCTALCADSTNIPLSLQRRWGQFEAIISSPPYATALPYIDTQRLSLVWLGLIEPSKIMPLEARLIGSREFRGREKFECARRLSTNADNLPRNMHSFCVQLQVALTPDDGFRRTAVPSLLYRYLVSMRQAFRSIAAMTAPGARGAFIVGHNHTVLGGKRFDIDTPQLLSELATACDFVDVERMPLDTYQRYGLHYRNSISKEELLLFRHR